MIDFSILYDALHTLKNTSTLQVTLTDLIHAITETMPISSTAHVTLFQFISAENITQNISQINCSQINGSQINKLHIIHLHLATSLSGILFLHKFIWKLFISLFQSNFDYTANFDNTANSDEIDNSHDKATPSKNRYRTAAYSCIIITLIQVLLSFPFSLVLNKLEANIIHTLFFISFGSIISGACLYASTLCPKWPQTLSWRHIMPVTLLQTLAFFPGVSRLGATLTALRTLGFSSESMIDSNKDSSKGLVSTEHTAWEYAIALGIPLSAGASFLTYIKHPESFNIHPVSFIILCLIAYFTYFISTKISLKAYGIYKCLFGISTLLFLYKINQI